MPVHHQVRTHSSSGQAGSVWSLPGPELVLPRMHADIDIALGLPILIVHAVFLASMCLNSLMMCLGVVNLCLATANFPVSVSGSLLWHNWCMMQTSAQQSCRQVAGVADVWRITELWYVGVQVTLPSKQQSCRRVGLRRL